MSKVVRLDKYLLLGLVLIVLAGGLLLLPKYDKNRGVEPEEYLKSISSSERYMTTDQLAEKMVNQDPSLILIDTRKAVEYNKFALPDAINIPLDSLFTESNEGYLDQDVYDVVLYSNDNFYADQAWLMCNRLGYQNLHVLKGGLNEWFSTIINPIKPSEGMANSAFELYNLRKATAMYFGVGTPISTSVVKKKKVALRKKKKRKAEGGC